MKSISTLRWLPLFALAAPAAWGSPQGELRIEEMAEMAPLANDRDPLQRQRAMDWILDPAWGALESEPRVQVALERVTLERDPDLARGWRLALATWDSDRARRWVEDEISRAPEPQALELVGALQANPLDRDARTFLAKLQSPDQTGDT